MVARLTIGKKAYAKVEARAREILGEAEQIRAELRRLVDEDAAAYAGVSRAYKIPKDDPSRARAVDDALLAAAQPPARVAKLADRVLRLAREIEEIGNKNASSDAFVAGGLAIAAQGGAMRNVKVNVAAMSDPSRGQGLL
jgi:formiminotetrahydrofolate cyclodeaminase